MTLAEVRALQAKYHRDSVPTPNPSVTRDEMRAVLSAFESALLENERLVAEVNRRDCDWLDQQAFTRKIHDEIASGCYRQGYQDGIKAGHWWRSMAYNCDFPVVFGLQAVCVETLRCIHKFTLNYEVRHCVWPASGTGR